MPSYLKGVREPVCEETPYSDWQADISKEEIVRVLKKNGYKADRIQKIKGSKKNRSGRFAVMIIYSNKGKIKLSSNKFRTLMGSRRIKSTKITSIRNKRDKISFTGQGWGHGVGMSQWGAKALADKGWNYKKILRLYFPGTRVREFRQ